MIATGGAHPSRRSGLAEAGFLTSETVFDLTALPARLAVLGGGPIGCELAQAFARFGARVVLVEVEGRLLPGEDADAAEIVRHALGADGVEHALGARLIHVERTPTGQRLTLDGPGGPRSVDVDSILVAVGRRPNVASLGLEAAGVRAGRQRSAPHR